MSERILGGIGTKMLFENDRVRVWELRLAPGESSAVHRHDLDHVLIEVSGDAIAVQPEPDTAGPFKDYLASPIAPGICVFVDRGGVETAINVGSEPFHEVIVELKD